MLSLKKIFFFLSVLISFSISAQKDSTQVDDLKIKGKINVNSNYFNPLSPSKAAFYSAIFPGGGQIYNKKYWKAPIVWGAMGTSEASVNAHLLQFNTNDNLTFSPVMISNPISYDIPKFGLNFKYSF